MNKHTPYVSLADASRIMGYDNALRAVNSHEELLQIVKDLRYRSFDSDFKGWDKKTLDKAIAKASESK